MMLAQLTILPASFDQLVADLTPVREMEALTERVRAAAKPVLSEDMVLLMRAGKDVPWEPAIFKELALTGRWDEQRLIRLIEGHYFEFIITREDFSVARQGESNYTPGVAHAIARAYPRTEMRAEHVLYLPPEN